MDFVLMFQKDKMILNFPYKYIYIYVLMLSKDICLCRFIGKYDDDFCCLFKFYETLIPLKPMQS